MSLDIFDMTTTGYGKIVEHVASNFEHDFVFSGAIAGRVTEFNASAFGSINTLHSMPTIASVESEPIYDAPLLTNPDVLMEISKTDEDLDRLFKGVVFNKRIYPSNSASSIKPGRSPIGKW